MTDIEVFEEFGSEDLIFHYTKFETFFCHILKNHTLRFSRLTEKNDPYEILPIKVPMTQRVFLAPEKIQLNEIEDLFDKERIRIGPTVRFASFCRNIENPIKGQPQIRNLGCLRMRMWSQYAQNHTGLCLVFSKSRLIDAITEQLRTLKSHPPVPMDVDYKDFWEHGQFDYPVTLSEMNDNNVLDYAKKYYLDLKESPLCKKDLDYQDEAEFRIVYISEKLEYVDYKDALIGVVFGVRTTCRDPEYLTQIDSTKDLRSWQIRFDDNGLFNLQRNVNQ